MPRGQQEQGVGAFLSPLLAVPKPMGDMQLGSVPSEEPMLCACGQSPRMGRGMCGPSAAVRSVEAAGALPLFSAGNWDCKQGESGYQLRWLSGIILVL